MNENILPYLVMDTCCFSNYYMTAEEREEGKENIHFDGDRGGQVPVSRIIGVSNNQ